MEMKNFILIIFLVISSNKISATIQRPDLLIIENDTLELREMNAFPLESLKLKFRPFNYTRKTAPNTACWRGYQAIWRIIDDEIYLEKIQRCYGDDNNNKFENLTEFFNKNQIDFIEKNGMILANWVNLNLHELKNLYFNTKNRKMILTDNSFGKKNPRTSDIILTIRNGTIEINNFKTSPTK